MASPSASTPPPPPLSPLSETDADKKDALPFGSNRSAICRQPRYNRDENVVVETRSRPPVDRPPPPPFFFKTRVERTPGQALNAPPLSIRFLALFCSPEFRADLLVPLQNAKITDTPAHLCWIHRSTRAFFFFLYFPETDHEFEFKL